MHVEVSTVSEADIDDGANFGIGVQSAVFDQLSNSPP